MVLIIECRIPSYTNRSLSIIKDQIKSLQENNNSINYYSFHEFNSNFSRTNKKNNLKIPLILCFSVEENEDNYKLCIPSLKKIKGLLIDCIYLENIKINLIFASKNYLKLNNNEISQNYIKNKKNIILENRYIYELLNGSLL